MDVVQGVTPAELGMSLRPLQPTTMRCSAQVDDVHRFSRHYSLNRQCCVVEPLVIDHLADCVHARSDLRRLPAQRHPGAAPPGDAVVIIDSTYVDCGALRCVRRKLVLRDPRWPLVR